MKTPPTFNPEENSDYISWKMDVEVWRMITKEAKKKHGPAVYLSLQGSAREKVRTIDMAKLNTDTGYEEVIALLDSVFLKDESTRAYVAFKTFVEYRRKMGDSYEAFIVAFEKLYSEIAKHKMELPSGAKAYFLLQAANMSEENERLARVSAKMEYDSMKDTVQKVFGNNNADGESLPVKTEEVNFTRRNFPRRGNGNHSGNFSQNRRDFQKPEQTDQNSRKKLNPFGQDGRRLKCFNCNSIEHLKTACPFQRKDVYTVDTEQQNVFIALMAKQEQTGCLMADTVGYGVLDSACTKTVVGKKWLEEYKASLSEEQRKQILESKENSSSLFRFGDGVRKRAQYRIKIPVYVAERNVKLLVDVVECDIPLLMSKETMEGMKMKIDFETGVANVLGQDINLVSTRSGHYCIPLSQCIKEEVCVVFNNELERKSREDKKRSALKLHRQFCHASFERLKNLLVQADIKDKEFMDILEATCKECTFCGKYRKQYPRPIVGFPETTFNSKVNMDLKEITGLPQKTWILHLIDSATRYTAATLIKTKKKEVVMERIMAIWIAYFGAPKKFHNDCGGEFCNEVLEEMHHKLGIEISSTPSEAPFSNGIVERNNKVLYEATMKTKEDIGCSLETALAWAVAAKNGLQNHGGYSPNQLVLGFNVNIPSVLNDKLPALTTTTQSEMLREKLNVLHQARQNFCKAEASNKIRTALRHQTRTYAEQIYKQGDRVYYQRKDSKDWQGPAKVLGKDDNFVLVREGKSIRRCHPCQLMKVIDAEGGSSTKESGTVEIELEDSEDEESLQDVNQRGEAQQRSTEETTAHDTSTIEEDREQQGPQARSEHGSSRNVPMALRRLLPHNEAGNAETFTATLEPAQVKEVKVKEAKSAELEKLKLHDVYDWVRDEGQETISCRWIITEKMEPGGEKIKARLVARGFEEVLTGKTESPTCSREALRMTYTVASTMSWDLQAMDMMSAFLQGNRIDRDVYVRPPREVRQEGMIWKLKRCLYGLVDAPRAWYDRVTEEMTKLGGTRSLYDKCMFLWHKNSTLVGMIITHVDDFEYCGTEEWKADIIKKLKTVFKVSRDEKEKFRFIGVEIRQDDTGVYVNQNKYCSGLKEIEIDTRRKLQTSKPLNEEEKKDLKMASGKLLWAISQTRPDMAFQGCQVSNAGSNPTVKILIDTNKAIRKMRTEQVEINYPPLGNPDNMKVVVYADGSHGALPSGNSQGAAIVFLQGGDRSAPITWRSKKIDRVTKSPLATEVSAVADGADLGHLIGSMTKEIFNMKEMPKIDIRTDSKSLKDHLETDRVIKDPRLRIDTARLRQMREKRELEMVWVPGTEQLADCLTKKAASTDGLKKALTCGVLPKAHLG